MPQAQARRIALAAQGLLDPRVADPRMRHLERVVARTGVLQIDSVNVLVRAHFMPLYSRLGPYRPALLSEAAEQSPRRLVEYWAHVASYMPVELWPVMAHRMDHYRERGHQWEAVKQDPAVIEQVFAEVAARGPCTARDLDDGQGRERTHWGWNWSWTKRALEYLFASGRVAIAGRNSQFERLYDLPERVLPAQVLAAEPLPPYDAHLDLVVRAGRALGVASARSIADYYRLPMSDTLRAIARATASGALEVVQVEGWREPAYLHPEARRPRRAQASALLSPFDPLVWERQRTRALFGFDYRIGIYTPAHKREHGYYALPFLLGDRLVARVDLKADRGRSTLVVKGAFGEANRPDDTGPALVGELEQMATWLGLGGIEIEPVGDLSASVAAALRRRG